ncbi:MAG: response regulator [bacterium]
MSPAPTYHVVVVEDDSVLADFLAKRLAIANLACVHYANGLDAVAGILSNQQIDLILLDISLPDIDGFEVLKRIQTDPRAAQIPVVIASNFSQEKDLEWGKKLGVKRFLNKASVTPSEIVDVALEVIAQK